MRVVSHACSMFSELGAGGPLRTISSTLGHWPLATSTADSNAVDDIALFGLVAETARFVGAGGS